jgi:uncharacterized RDD family membrane protein YckC
MTATPVYASFGRRVAALAIDALCIAVVLAAIVQAVNTGLGPRLAEFWSRSAPLHTGVEYASRESGIENGIRRETIYSRETRHFADGTIRIFAVAESRFTAADGTTTTTRAEELIGRNARDLLRRWSTFLLGFVLAFGYFAAFEASALQGTPGKTLLGLRVADLSGRRLGVGRSLFRQLMKSAELTSSGITYVIAAFTGRRQALHDLFAGTIVIQSPRAASSPRRAAVF